MFAVPGWAVPTASLTQEQPKPSKSKSKHSREQTDRSTTSTKRKAEDELGSTKKISGDDLENLWKQSSHGKRQKQEAKVKKNEHSPRIAEGGKSSSPKKGFQDRAPHTTEQLSRPSGKRQKDDEHKSAQLRNSSSVKHDISSTVSKMIPPQPAPAMPTTTLTPLQAKMRSKLTSARFRHLNEKLYTSTSAAALDLFNTAPELFAEYHAGFSQQVKDSWPQNPVDDYIRAIKVRGQSQGPDSLPRRKTGSCTIADLGCGDAPLARGSQAKVKDLKLKFHNYDLHAANSFVTKADISNLPLRDGEADIAVFCLSLMGTNWISFVEEAWRILRGDGRGEVWVSEVKSRFGKVTKGRVVENSVGKKKKKDVKSKEANDDAGDAEIFVEDIPQDEVSDATDISAFAKVFQRRGFVLREGSVNKRNKMFVSMIFTKSGVPVIGKYEGLKWNGTEYQKQGGGKQKPGFGKEETHQDASEEAKSLKPCVYKTR